LFSIRLHGLPALAGVILFGACGGESSHADRPDVLLICLDTTRADALGPFRRMGSGLFDGDRAAKTPFLDQLAKESLVFSNAWAGSTWTGPSSATIFTGLIPPRHGLILNLWAQVATGRDERKLLDYMADVELIAMPTSVPTIPEHMQAAGYQTVGVSTNPNLCEDFGFTRGFDVFHNLTDVPASETVDDLLGLVQALDENRPRFFFLHLNDPHTPYVSHAPWCQHTTGEGCNNQCRYRSEISFLDAELRRLFDSLSLADDAVVILVNDHGEEFHDHGDIGHRYSVHQELARAALLIRAPGVQPRRTDLPAHQMDILPTLLHILDLAPPETRDGISLLGALDDAEQRLRPLITHREGGQDGAELWGLTLGRWRLMEEVPEGFVKLYDIEQDPLELNDLSETRPEILAGLRGRLAKLRADLKPIPFEHIKVNMTAKLTEELIKLGYAGEH